MSNPALDDYFDSVIKREAIAMLAPRIEQVANEYILLDREKVADLLSIGLSKFDELRKLPQIALVEHRLPNTSKILFVPKELSRAVYSILE
ncbi:hypothetical protein WJM93_13990 [Lactiplantibacillus plantarum]|uniref:hypothetical protein n=1 Tax=Lactiplantibacillus plantarum TaxID=1590 RepID=UPI0030A129B8